MKEIKVGLIGTGFMGNVHAFCYKTIPLYYKPDFKITLCGVASGNFENALSVKERYSFEFAAKKEDELFARKDIDVINICTPNALHKSQILKALDAGKHIYCEKPVAASAAEAGEILAHPNINKVAAQTVFHNRFFASTLRAKQIIDSGRLGQILAFRGRFLSPSNVNPLKPVEWRMRSESAGGGVLYDLGSHIFDMTYFLLGKFKSVYGRTQIPYKTRPDGNGGTVNCELDEAAYCVVEMQNGALGTIEAGKLSAGADADLKIEINGTKGSLILDLSEPDFLYFYNNTLPGAKDGGLKGFQKIECPYYDVPTHFPKGKHPLGWVRAHAHSLYCFLDAVNQGKQTAPSLADGLYVQSVLDAVYQSSTLGRPVFLTEY